MQRSDAMFVERLRSLEIPSPNPAAVTRSVLSRGGAGARQHRRPGHGLAAAASVVVLLAGSWASLYLVPAAGLVIASAPVVGAATEDMLRYAGLATGASVTAQNSVATSSGYQVELTGAYADPLRTVVLLRFLPPDAHAFRGVTLKDQFGTTYDQLSGSSDSRTGAEHLTFAPPSWIALHAGLRFSVDLDGLEVGTMNQPIAGRWSLHGVVVPGSARALALPAAGDLGPGRVTFDSLRYAGRVLQLKGRVAGVSEAQLLATSLSSGGKPRRLLQAALVNSQGEQTLIGLGVTSQHGVVMIEGLAYNVVPGSYLLTISLEGTGSLERRVDVR